jgi:Glycosyl transferase family 2
MRTCVVCSVKDEGPFLVEWVAWYRMLGFRRIVVITNDCTDHSPALLDALSAAGWITHLRCDIPPGGRITDTKLALARRTPLVYRADWVFVCDVDEFLVVHVGENQISDLLTYPEAPFLGMAINWQVFGDAGKTQWSDSLTHRDHLRAAPPGHRNAVWQKSLFYQPRWFTSLGEHGPRGLQRGRVDPTFPAQGIRWVTAPICAMSRPKR